MKKPYGAKFLFIVLTIVTSSAHARIKKPTWMGYTATTYGHMGGTTRGIKGANTLCNSAYSGSHACKWKEIIQLGTIYTYTSDAWIVDGARTVDDGTSAYQNTIDGYDSQTSGALYPNCNGWQSNSALLLGAYVDTYGKLRLTGCNVGTALPCCK